MMHQKKKKTSKLPYASAGTSVRSIVHMRCGETVKSRARKQTKNHKLKKRKGSNIWLRYAGDVRPRQARACPRYDLIFNQSGNVHGSRQHLQMIDDCCGRNGWNPTRVSASNGLIVISSWLPPDHTTNEICFPRRFLHDRCFAFPSLACLLLSLRWVMTMIARWWWIDQSASRGFAFKRSKGGLLGGWVLVAFIY